MAYRGQADEIFVGNEGEDVANNFYWKIQQCKLSAHLHRSARGKWEAVEGVETRRRWCESSEFALLISGSSREALTRKRRNGKGEIPHCSDPTILLHHHQHTPKCCRNASFLLPGGVPPSLPRHFPRDCKSPRFYTKQIPVVTYSRVTSLSRDVRFAHGCSGFSLSLP